MDKHNPIHSNDNRLIRRMVRDYRYRGYSAKDSLSRWLSVRKGEENGYFLTKRKQIACLIQRYCAN